MGWERQDRGPQTRKMMPERTSGGWARVIDSPAASGAKRKKNWQGSAVKHCLREQCRAHGIVKQAGPLAQAAHGRIGLHGQTQGATHLHTGCEHTTSPDDVRLVRSSLPTHPGDRPFSLVNKLQESPSIHHQRNRNLCTCPPAPTVASNRLHSTRLSGTGLLMASSRMQSHYCRGGGGRTGTACNNAPGYSILEL